MSARLEAVHPVLMSSDVSASVAFFERLGFRVTFVDREDNPSYVAVTRDGVTVHLPWHARKDGEGDHDRPTYR